MKIVTYEYEERMAPGAVHHDQVYDLTVVAGDVLSLIDRGAAGLEQATAVIEQSAPVASLDRVKLLAPIPRPRRNIFCLGLNYREHVHESFTARGREPKVLPHPIFFTKATRTVNGPYAPIPFDPAVSEQIDWEVELAVVLGRGGKNIPAAEAMAHVFGYTVMNDVSARDIQVRHGGQYFKGKSLDGSCPMGPWLVTAAELPHPHNLRLVSRVNGVVKQDGNTAAMIFDIPAIIAALSQGMTLEAGDLIATGTPEGVGFARKPPEFLRPGDVLESEIEGIGLIRNVIEKAINVAG
jgi:2-keto-4-pentenoate hydratase/2-oxohepta-3-ene-1,7-dioic acid hydratase in catechol pathway